VKWRSSFSAAALGFLLLGSLFAFQRPFREYPGMEYEGFPVPADAQVKAEWVFARLMYPPSPEARFGGSFGQPNLWTQGYTSWTNDYPRADRHFIQEVRRLTRVEARAVEQPVNLDDDNDVYNWPWLYAVQTGQWELTQHQTRALRDYLLRGGFLVCDDLWGTRDWNLFMASMQRVFPDRPVLEIANDDPIFHTVYDLDDRYGIPGQWSLHLAVPYMNDGYEGRWRGIYDDKGRLMVAINVNSDTGDSWEWADSPEYPEKYSALGMRIGVNYVVYGMTH
jgi:hypothetical protein